MDNFGLPKIISQNTFVIPLLVHKSNTVMIVYYRTFSLILGHHHIAAVICSCVLVFGFLTKINTLSIYSLVRLIYLLLKRCFAMKCRRDTSICSRHDVCASGSYQVDYFARHVHRPCRIGESTPPDATRTRLRQPILRKKGSRSLLENPFHRQDRCE